MSGQSFTSSKGDDNIVSKTRPGTKAAIYCDMRRQSFISSEGKYNIVSKRRPGTNAAIQYNTVQYSAILFWEAHFQLNCLPIFLLLEAGSSPPLGPRDSVSKRLHGTKAAKQYNTVQYNAILFWEAHFLLKCLPIFSLLEAGNPPPLGPGDSSRANFDQFARDQFARDQFARSQI